MKNNNIKRVLIALSIVTILIFSCMSVSVFADEPVSGTEAATGTTVETGTSTEVGSADETTGSEPSESETGAVTGSETTGGETTGAETTGNGTTATTTGSADSAKEPYDPTSLIVTLGVVLVILIIALIYYFRNTEKVKKFWRGYKAELGKITWLPKDELKKNSILVVIIVIIAVIVIALFDIIFSWAIWTLMRLFM